LFYVLQEQNLCSGHDVPEHLRVTKLPINTNFASKIAFAPVDEQSSQHRLQEARRLMLGEHLDAASAGYRVGYDNPAHFSREYKSLFGLPPLRDVERLRGVSGKTAVSESINSQSSVRYKSKILAQ